MTAVAATLLALCFALIVTRSRLPGRRLVGVLAVLPMITPPFVIGLALIMLFGRSGAVNALLEWAFGIGPSRWIYGLPGVWLAQTLALTPVAYLVLVGVVDGISPSLEEAAQTLRASTWTTFTTVTLPLLAPGLVNAFLVVFIESLADFGNPLLLGGNLEVLSVAIYFAIVGVQQDPGRAAILALVLLAPVARALRPAAAARRAARLRHDLGQRGGRAAPAAAARGGRHRRLPRRAVGGARRRRVHDDLRRRLLREMGAQSRADAAALRDGLRRRGRERRARSGPAAPGAPSRRR